MSQPNLHAVIGGGGLAGSLLALALAKRGYRVTVIEKRPDLRGKAAPGGRSINLALSERGLYALGKVGLAEKALSQTIPMRGRLVHDLSGATNFLPYSNKSSEFIRSISRPGLNRMLLEEASLHPNIELHFDVSVEEINQEEKTIVVLNAQNRPSKFTFDLLFGTDGAGSSVRKSLGFESEKLFSSKMLGHSYKELEMPSLPNGDYAMSPEALHIWPRGTYMMIALPNLDRSFTCTLFLPNDGSPGFNQLKNPGALRAFFHEQFADAVPFLPSFEEDFFSNPTGGLGTVRCSSWTTGGHSLILGDAAHAIVPFFGQGMNAAFEDVSELCEMMDASANTDWPRLLTEFESSRIPNTNAIADMALENYIEMRDLVADDAFKLRRRVALELEVRFPNRFTPRYSLVSFSRVPYKTVQDIGHRQSEILFALCQDTGQFENIDWSRAEQLISELPEIHSESQD